MPIHTAQFRPADTILVCFCIPNIAEAKTRWGNFPVCANRYLMDYWINLNLMSTASNWQGNRIFPSLCCHSHESGNPPKSDSDLKIADLVQPSSNEHAPLRPESYRPDSHLCGNDISKSGVPIPHAGLRQAQPTAIGRGEQVSMTSGTQENAIAMSKLASQLLKRYNHQYWSKIL